MILPYEAQPYPDQIGKRYPPLLAGIRWEAVFAGVTHRGLNVLDLVAEWGRTGRGYSKHGTWLVALDDLPGN
jgi:hypothetical protein